MKNRMLRLTILTFVALSMLVGPTFAAGISGGLPATDTNLNATVKPDHIILTWSGDPKITQTITWRTSTAVSTGYVQYKKLSTANVTMQTLGPITPNVFSNASGTEKQLGSCNMYTAQISGLTPGTTYTYRVGDGNSNWSCFSTFTTEKNNNKSFKFLLFGDSQDAGAKYTDWKTTLNKAYNANRDAKFMVNVGDLQDAGQEYANWNFWFDSVKGIVDHIPEMPCIGNHENYRLELNSAANLGNDGAGPVYYIANFGLPQNGPNTTYDLRENVYSYDYGNVHFVSIDNTWRERFLYAENNMAQMNAMKAEVKEWLVADLAATDKLFKVVYFHKPTYYNCQLRTNNDMQDFQSVFDAYHVDLVLNGHDHAIARTVPVMYDSVNKINIFNQLPANNKKYTVGGKTVTWQGTVYYTAGRSSNNKKDDIGPKVWNAFYYNAMRSPVYQTVEVDGGKLTIKAFEQDGNLLNSYTIDKYNPGNTTPSYSNALNGAYDSGKTRLVLYGVPIIFGKNCIQSNNKWYIDFNVLLTYTGSSFNSTTKKWTFTNTGFNTNDALHFNDTLISSGVAQLSDDMFQSNDINKMMISIDALKSLGFDCEYHSETNTVMVEWGMPD